MTGKELLKIILAILLPPVGVFLQVGFGGHFWLNILLTILGYIPGIVHAVWGDSEKQVAGAEALDGCRLVFTRQRGWGRAQQAGVQQAQFLNDPGNCF